MVNKLTSYFIPVLLAITVGKSVAFGSQLSDSLAIGFLCSVYGVQLWFYLKRLHQIESKKLLRMQADIKELKTQLSSIKLLTNKSQPQQGINFGNVPWP